MEMGRDHEAQDMEAGLRSAVSRFDSPPEGVIAEAKAAFAQRNQRQVLALAGDSMSGERRHLRFEGGGVALDVVAIAAGGEWRLEATLDGGQPTWGEVLIGDEYLPVAIAADGTMTAQGLPRGSVALDVDAGAHRVRTERVDI